MVGYHKPGGLVGGVNMKHAPNELRIPFPVVFGIGCTVNTYETLPRSNEALHNFLLRRIENVTGGVQKNNDVVLLQMFIGKTIWILEHVNCKLLLLRHLLQRYYTIMLRLVMPAIRGGD